MKTHINTLTESEKDLKTFGIRTIKPILEEGEGKTILAVQVWNRVPDTVEVTFETREDALYYHKVAFANECVTLPIPTEAV